MHAAAIDSLRRAKDCTRVGIDAMRGLALTAVIHDEWLVDYGRRHARNCDAPDGIGESASSTLQALLGYIRGGYRAGSAAPPPRTHPRPRLGQLLGGPATGPAPDEVEVPSRRRDSVIVGFGPWSRLALLPAANLSLTTARGPLSGTSASIIRPAQSTAMWLASAQPPRACSLRACHARAMLHEIGAPRPIFQPGDHLRVRRRWGYDHHGIYINDSRVIQFGGRICDKLHANIEAVSLERFEAGGRAEVVVHGGKQRWFRWLPWFGAWLPPADSPEKIVRRAEWLLEHHPTGRYQLMGWNCEHAANFCVNEYTESLQARRFFFVNAWIGLIMACYISLQSRRGRSVRRGLVLTRIATTVVTVWLYNVGIRRFWKDVGQEWRTYERAH